MRIPFLPILLTLMALPLPGQTVFPLYPQGAPCPSGLPTTADREDGLGLIVRTVGEPELYHYAPVPWMATGGAVMVVPGGGYSVLAWDHEGVVMARRLASAGIHAFVLRHRLPAHQPEPCKRTVALDDARRGLRTVRWLADSLGYGADRIAVMGFSAGGHLAGSLGVHATAGDPQATDPVERVSSRADHNLLVYPVLIMDRERPGHAGTQHALLGDNPAATDLAYFNLPGRVDSATAPTLLVHASDDLGVLVRNSLRFYEALVRHGVPADLRVYAAGGHGFGTATQRPGPIARWLEEAIAWLRAYGY